MGLLKGKVQLNCQTASVFVTVLCFAAAAMGMCSLLVLGEGESLTLSSLHLGACTCGISFVQSKSVWVVLAVVTEKGQLMYLC